MAGKSADSRRSVSVGWTLHHRPTVRRARSARDDGYWELSARPLHILIFLIPFIVLFEVGASRYLFDAAHESSQTIRAWSMLLVFFQEFGVAGRFLPAATIITVLLVWHVMLRDSWRPRPMVIGGMFMESLVWTVPLVVAVKLVLLFGASAHAAAQVTVQSAGGIDTLSREGRATISIGAGLYEELLFRMIGVALLHAVFVDLCRLGERWGTILAVVIAAAAFAAYHDPKGVDGHVDVIRMISLVVAGSYFGAVYVARGFGIVVAVHAMYDLLVLVALRPGA